jgi:NAD-dependent dihydropyrimidine dehydrogenase PreA subunit/flavodoxin
MTKAIIVCLSYTGNTLRIAEAIQKGVAPLITQTDMVRLRETDPKTLAGYDLIGIGSPVRLGKMPAELAAFIEGMDGMEGKHCFVFNTHAALPVDFMRQSIAAVKGKGLRVIGFKNWYCAVFLPYVPKPYFTDGHPDDIDLQEAEDFGREIVHRSQGLRAGEPCFIPSLPEGSLYEEIYGARMTGSLPQEVMAARAQGFSVDPNKCTRCGYCVDLCPTRSIDFSGEQPAFGPCDQCWLCEQTCPEGAISFNYPPLHRSHNKVVAERFVPALRKAQLAGRFRPLVRTEDVGWDTPLFITKKPPRFKIV